MFGEAGQLGLTFPLESVQDLVKKTERANWGETYTIRQKHPEEFPKLCKVGELFQLIFHQIRRPKPNQWNVDNR